MLITGGNGSLQGYLVVECMFPYWSVLFGMSQDTEDLLIEDDMKFQKVS